MPFDKDIHRTKNPFELFLLGLALFSAVPQAMGVIPGPPTLESQMGGYVRIWGALLALGCFLSLVGIFWPRPKDVNRFTVTGLILEEIGMVAVAGATIYYASALLLIIGKASLTSACITLAFGIACATHAWRIRNFLKGLQ